MRPISACNKAPQRLVLIKNTENNLISDLFTRTSDIPGSSYTSDIPGPSRTNQYQDLRQASHTCHLQQSQTQKNVTPEQLDFWIEKGRLSMNQERLPHFHKNEKIAKEIRKQIANQIRDLNNQTIQDSLTLKSIDLPLALQQIACMIAGNQASLGFIPVKSTSFSLHDSRDKYSMSLIDTAAYRGYTEAIHALIALGVSADQRMPNGATLVHTAASNGKINTINTLIALGANVNEPDNDGATPLFYAAKNDQIIAIDTLKQLNANVKAQDKTGATPLHIAAGKGKINAIETLIELGANVNEPDNDGATPLFYAAKNDQAIAIDTLKKLNADVNIPNIEGKTPVFIAAQNNNVNAIRVLKKVEADIHQPNIHDKTPISIAKENSFTRIVRHLSKGVTQKQLDLWVKEGRLSKMDAKLEHPHKNEKIARKLREFFKDTINAYNSADPDDPPALAGIDLPLALQQIAHTIAGDHQVPGFIPLNYPKGFTLQIRDRQSRGLFHFATYHNHLEAIKMLAALGGKANQWFSDGKSPLHFAAYNGQIDAIRTLVAAGASINRPNNKGTTPLFLAAQNGQINAIHALLDLGANVNERMNNFETPVFFAARFGHSDAITTLKKRGAEINARMSEDGTSAIFFAAHEGHTDAVRTLIDLGADYRSPNRDGKTPLEIAKNRGYPDIVRLLSNP